MVIKMESKFALRNGNLKTLELWPYRKHERSRRELQRKIKSMLDSSSEKKKK